MVSRYWGIAATMLLLLTSSVAQNKNASVAEEQQPPDLHYELAIKDGRTLFHLGEAIEIEESYSADVPNKYLLLSLPQQVKGHPVQVMIEPGSGVIDRLQDDGTRNANSILQSNCFYGHGSGIGSGCGDCDSRRPLSSSPIRSPIDLTRPFRQRLLMWFSRLSTLNRVLPLRSVLTNLKLMSSRILNGPERR